MERAALSWFINTQFFLVPGPWHCAAGVLRRCRTHHRISNAAVVVVVDSKKAAFSPNQSHTASAGLVPLQRQVLCVAKLENLYPSLLGWEERSHSLSPPPGSPISSQGSPGWPHVGVLARNVPHWSTMAHSFYSEKTPYFTGRHAILRNPARGATFLHPHSWVTRKHQIQQVIGQPLCWVTGYILEGPTRKKWWHVNP